MPAGSAPFLPLAALRHPTLTDPTRALGARLLLCCHDEDTAVVVRALTDLFMVALIELEPSDRRQLCATVLAHVGTDRPS